MSEGNSRKAKGRFFTIINPISGTGRKTSLPETVFKVLNDPERELFFTYSQESGDAQRLVRLAEEYGFDTIIGVGGDGTINEIADAVRHTNMTLGIVPAGSGNGLARSLSIPMDPEKALEVIKQGNIRPIDSCEANGRPFFVTFGVGFDAQVTASYDQKDFRGPLSYVISTIDQFIKHKPVRYRLTFNEEVVEQDAFLITCANADQYGNNAYIAPDAKPDDGLFDVVVIHDVTLLNAPHIAVSLFNKRIAENASIDIYRTDHLIIERDEPSLVQTDGESLEMGRRIEITINKQQLPVYVPTVKLR